MTATDEKMRAIAERMAKGLADNGMLIEAGFQIYRLLLLKVPAHEARDDLREAFEAGAEHLFYSLLGAMDPGVGETPADMRRMDLLHAELEPIRQRLRLKYGRTAGSA